MPEDIGIEEIGPAFGGLVVLFVGTSRQTKNYSLCDLRASVVNKIC